MIHRVINEPHVPMKEYRADIPPVLEKFVSRALEKDPAKRYKMGIDMASDLATAFSHLERPQEDISIKEKFNYVKELDFFRGFPDSEIWEIIRASVWEEHDQGDEIISEGDIEDSFYIITEGIVAVNKGEIIMGELRARRLFRRDGLSKQNKAHCFHRCYRPRRLNESEFYAHRTSVS